jgi:phosphoglycolate phosphatase-like HAD superfamily hydrolase
MWYLSWRQGAVDFPSESDIMGGMHVCLFDIDGTLINSMGAGKAAMEAALADEFGVPRLLDGVPYSGRTDRAIGRDLLRVHGIDDSPAMWDRLARAYLKRLPGSLARHRGRVLPGIGQLLSQLGKRDDVVLGLLTGNIEAGARAKLGHFNLFHHFVFGAYGDLHCDRNEVARAALAATRTHLNRAPDLERIWVVGDTPLDVRCGRAIGAKVVAVGTGWNSLEELEAEKPDVLAADLSDPTPLFTAMGI